MVTGPMPRKPNATRPNAKTAGAIIKWARPRFADQVADGHQHDHGQAEVVCGEIARDEAGQNAERSAAFFRGDDDFFYVARFGGSEDFHQFGNDGAGERAAGNDRRQLPPLRGISAEYWNNERRDDVGEARWKRKT